MNDKNFHIEYVRTELEDLGKEDPGLIIKIYAKVKPGELGNCPYKYELNSHVL